MSIKIIKREYLELFTNNISNWLLGNVGDWQKATVEVEVGIDYVADMENPIEVNYLLNAFVIQSGKKWGDFGFDAGMTITLSYKKSVDTNNDGEYDDVSEPTLTFTATNVYGSTMEVAEPIDLEGFDNIPLNYGNIKISEAVFIADRKPEGCRLTYGHIDNDQAQSGQLNSMIDGSTTGFDLPNLNALTPGTFGNMNPIGNQSGMSVRNVKVKENADAFGYFASYVVPESQLYDLRMERENIFSGDCSYTSAVPLGMFLQVPVPTYQNEIGTFLVGQQQELPGAITSVDQFQCFLLNAASTYTQQFSLNFNWKMVAVYLSSNPGFIKLKVIKTLFAASPMPVVTETTLRTWDNLYSLVGSTLNYNDIFEIDVESGYCYALVLHFDHIPSGLNNYGANIQVLSGTMNASEPGETLAQTYKRKYTFEFDFMISNAFENISTFEELTAPDYLQGNRTLADNFKFEFLPVWNNPNLSISNDMSDNGRTGNVGWFNENYNQLPNRFTVDELRYFDLNSNEVEAVDYFAPTKVTGIISGIANVSALTLCGFGFMWVPKNEEDFKNLTTPFYRNVFAQTGSYTNAYNVGTFYPTINSGAGLGGAIDSRNVKFTSLGGGRVSFEVLLTPDGGFTNFFDTRTDEDRNYIFWVSIADPTLARNQSDRVNLLCDFNAMVKNIPLAGAYPGINAEFLNHPAEDDEPGETEYDGFVVDDVLARMPFIVDYTTSTIEKMKFGVQAYNPTTQERKVLEKFEYNMASYPIDGAGVAQFALDTTRGFKLESGNNKNWVKIERNAIMDSAGSAGYLAFFAFRIRYEDWLAMLDVPAVFFDAAELNNGFNNDWFHYFNTAGWKLAFFTEIDITESGVLREYRNLWDVKVQDNDQNSVILTDHKYIRDSNDAVLNIGTDADTGRPLGVILSNEPTRIEISYTIQGSGEFDPLHLYATTTLEIDKGAGIYELRQLSSVWGSEPDNPLIPIAGETKLKITVSPDNKTATTYCLVDPDLLPNAGRYRITGRIGCYDGTRPPVTFGKYEDRYEDKYE